MSGSTLYILILLLALSGYFIRNWYDGPKLRKYILCLVNRGDARWYDYQFLNCTQEQLLYPLSDDQLLLMRSSKQWIVNQADIHVQSDFLRLWRISRFHVRYDISGIDAAGTPFSLREEGYLKVSIMFDHSLHSPIITDIKTSRTPL